MAQSVLVIGLLAVSALSLTACSKEDASAAAPKTKDASVAPAAPKNLDLARAALVSARAKYAKHEVVDAE